MLKDFLLRFVYNIIVFFGILGTLSATMFKIFALLNLLIFSYNNKSCAQ